MPDKGGRKQVYHVNYLRKWTDRGCQVIEDGDGIEPYQWTNNEQIKLGRELTEQQKSDIIGLLSRYKQLTSTNPGRTKSVEHQIRTTNSTQVRQKPYRIPQAYIESR